MTMIQETSFALSANRGRNPSRLEEPTTPLGHISRHDDAQHSAG